MTQQLKKSIPRQKVVKFFEKRYGIEKGRSVAKKYRRLRKYKLRGQYIKGKFYCKLGKLIDAIRINKYELMCHKLVRSYLPALALYEASLDYEDLVARCRTEIFLALLDGFDPVKAMTCKEKDPKKREQIIREKRANPEQTYSDSEKSIVWGRLNFYLRRIRWNYHPDQRGGKTEALEPGTHYDSVKNYERSRGVWTEFNQGVADVVLKRRDRLLGILEKNGPEAVRKAFEKMSDMGKEELLDLLKKVQEARCRQEVKIMGEESWMSD